MSPAFFTTGGPRSRPTAYLQFITADIPIAAPQAYDAAMAAKASLGPRRRDAVGIERSTGGSAANLGNAIVGSVPATAHPVSPDQFGLSPTTTLAVE